MGKRNVGGRRGGVPLMSNIADICRECELSQKVQQLEQAGDILSELASDLLCEREISITDIFRLENAVDNWHKAKEEAE